jgi:hypothetical protein
MDPPPSTSTTNGAMHATAGTANITAMGSSMATVPGSKVIMMDDEDDQDSDSDSEVIVMGDSDSEVIVMDNEDDLDSDSDSEVIVMDDEDDQDQDSDHIEDDVARGEIDPPPPASSTTDNAMHVTTGTTATTATATAIGSTVTCPDPDVVSAILSLHSSLGLESGPTEDI